MGTGTLKRWSRRLAGFTVASALLVSAALGLTNYEVIRESRMLEGLSPANIYDVALVPGCHVDGMRPTPTLAARLSSAVALYRAGRVHRILVTGNGDSGETAAMSHWLV